MIKKTVLTLLLLSSGFLASAAPPRLITLSQFEIGKAQWPFTREEVILTCREGNTIYAINPGTLMQYPLNDAARRQAVENGAKSQSIATIVANDPAHSGNPKSLEPIIARAYALCAK